MPLAALELLAKPTEVDHFIKTRYWELIFSKSISTRPKHRISEIHNDICSYTHFWANLVQNPAKFTWIMRQNFKNRGYLDFLSGRAFRMMAGFMDNLPKDKDGNLTAAGMNALIRYLELLWKYVHPNSG